MPKRDANVKKIIFWGDGPLSGPGGYGELLENHVILHHPRTAVSMSIQGAENILLADALREAPLHAIGKDPHLLYLAFGHADIRAGRGAAEIIRSFQDLTDRILQKTHARVCLSTLIAGFFGGDGERERIRAVNAHLRGLRDPRIGVADLDAEVDAFLREHRQNEGDQHALHLDSARLTALGRLHLAHHAYRLVPWPELQDPPLAKGTAPAAEAAASGAVLPRS
jgi:hypothetical protein